MAFKVRIKPAWYSKEYVRIQYRTGFWWHTIKHSEYDEIKEQWHLVPLETHVFNADAFIKTYCSSEASIKRHQEREKQTVERNSNAKARADAENSLRIKEAYKRLS